MNAGRPASEARRVRLPALPFWAGVMSAFRARLGAMPVLDERGLWEQLLPPTALQPHARHSFENEIRSFDGATHVRFNIYPDGGVGRLRVYGRPD